MIFNSERIIILKIQWEPHSVQTKPIQLVWFLYKIEWTNFFNKTIPCTLAFKLQSKITPHITNPIAIKRLLYLITS